MSAHDLFDRVEDILKSHGFRRDHQKTRGKGGHIAFTHAERSLTVRLPHQLHDRGLGMRILRQQAGISGVRL